MYTFIQILLFINLYNDFEFCDIIEHLYHGCTCSDYINESGFGNCTKLFSPLRNQKVCYVNLPSSCSDEVDSRTNPGKKLSAEACQKREEREWK